MSVFIILVASACIGLVVGRTVSHSFSKSPDGRKHVRHSAMTFFGLGALAPIAFVAKGMLWPERGAGMMNFINLIYSVPFTIGLFCAGVGTLISSDDGNA